MVGVVARVAIGVVLLWAGIAKLRDRNWAANTAPGLQLPVPLLTPMPVIELVVGAACVAQVPFAPIAANLLMVGYLIVVVNLLMAHGDDAPPCACFGATPTHITWRTAARNVAFLALSIVSVMA